jgi:hypothetical protein
LLVLSCDVVHVPIAQLAEQGMEGASLSTLKAVCSIAQQSDEAKMLGAVLGEAGKAALLHEPLLAGEMHAGEFDQSIDQRVHRFLAGSVDHGLAELVHGVHEDAVLVVEGADADGAGVVPGEKGHGVSIDY